MIQNVLSRIDGVGLYGVISICLFFALFVSVVIWMLRLGKPYLNSMRALPLADDGAPARHDQPNQPEEDHESL
jgi:cytochrome c oxidase cbb3-type subunit 4